MRWSADQTTSAYARSVPPARSFIGDLRVVLQGRDFRKLFAVRLVSQASDGAFQVGLASLVFFSPEREATTTAAAVAAAVTVLPYTLVGPFAGVLLDVWPRRQVLLVANAVRAVMVVGLAGLVLGGTVQLPVYAGALACLSVNRFFLAGLGASLPQVVPRHELVMANAVSPTCGTISAVLGAAAGYGLGRLVGSGDATDALILLVAAVGYALSALLARRMSRDLLGPSERAPMHVSSLGLVVHDVLADLAAGAGHVRERHRARDALGVIGAHRIAYGVWTIALLLLCRNRLNDSADVDAGLALLAQVVTVIGVGFAVAALITPPAAARWGTVNWIIACMTGSALIAAVLTVTMNAPLLLLSAFVLGITAQGAKICVDAIVQDDVDDAYRGRVFAFYDVVFNVAFVSAAGVAVLVVPSDGYSVPVYAGITLAYATAAAGYRFSRRSERGAAQPTTSLTSPPPLPPIKQTGVDQANRDVSRR